MTPQVTFSVANFVAAAGWIVLIAGIVVNRPVWRDTVAGKAVPLALSTAYTLLIAIFWWKTEGGFDSLTNVQQLFSSPWVALAGWAHYLAFDLAIAALIARQFMERGLSRLLLIPVLPLAFLFGPIGYLLSQIILFPSAASKA